MEGASKRGATFQAAPSGVAVTVAPSGGGALATIPTSGASATGEFHKTLKVKKSIGVLSVRCV